MRRFRFAKLVRDKILPDMLKNGQGPHYKVLSDKAFDTELKRKIIEEASELPKASHIDVVGEIADIQECIDAWLKLHSYSKKFLRKIQSRKNLERGSFKKKYYVDSVKAVKGSKWLKYYLTNPDKYPEIKG